MMNNDWWIVVVSLLLGFSIGYRVGVECGENGVYKSLLEQNQILHDEMEPKNAH